jgi:hypothetical protein
MPPPPAEPAKPPTNAEAMPATKPETLPPIDVGAWARVGAAIQGGRGAQDKLNDWHMDNAYVELHAGGKITKNVGITVNVNANMLNFGGAPAVNPATMAPNPAGDQIGSTVGVEDAIIQFDFDDAFHVWGGHLLVPVDRANSCGPFFMIPWNYPGFFAGVSAPKEGPYGRNNGAVVWGDAAGGKFTYLAGAFDDASVDAHPFFSGRVRLALMDPEPGFWGNCSYFGDHDIFSVAAGAQYQKTVVAGAKDYTEVNADVLFEKKIAGGGWVTGEGAYYHFNVDDGGISDALYVLGAYATPTLGYGNLQPMARFQWEKIKNPMAGAADSLWNLDVAATYLIKGPALRVLLTYSHSKLSTDASANSIQLGAQAIFF